MNGYIYKFTNKINGKVYIGQTRQKLKTRYNQHIIWTLKNHEDRITQNTEDINFLKQQLQSQQELILKLL